MTTFIGEYAIDPGMCDELIELHKNNPKKTPGRIGENKINPSIKASTDSDYSADENDTIKKYVSMLQSCLDQYGQMYRWADEGQEKFVIWEKLNIQHYAPGQGYPQWHYENSGHEVNVRRHLVFMTFLNTVTDEGYTEFWYQKIRKTPIKGLTLIWPSAWTHTHHGIPSLTQDKYIATGWWNHLQEEQFGKEPNPDGLPKVEIENKNKKVWYWQDEAHKYRPHKR
tara:strand:- start:698 stop:1372 length:675 start_codon:yes stop_codon:yes gene_type:complete